LVFFASLDESSSYPNPDISPAKTPSSQRTGPNRLEGLLTAKFT
jgi:hypothetical protein